MKMKYAILLLILGLTSVSASQALAVPSADLRVVMVDPEAGGFDGALTFSTVPANGDVFTLHQTGDLSVAERLVAYGGDIFVANDVKVSKISLDASGQPDPDVNSSVSDVTGEDFGSGLTGIAVDSNGMIYVADFDNQIYVLDPSDAPTASSTPLSVDQDFFGIRDIIIDGNLLYVLDLDGDGAIYSVDLASPSPHAASPIYDGADEPLSFASSIAVNNGDVFVSGEFNFGPGIIKITNGVATQFSNESNQPFSIPFGLAVDDVENVLYVSNQTAIYRFSLSAPMPSTPLASPPAVKSNNFFAPAGLATLVISGQVAETELSLTKTANSTSILPGQGILYTLTATNSGPDTATSVIIHDLFPNQGNGQIESYVNPQTNQLSYTATVHTSGGTFEAGSCERRSNNAFIVDCSGFGPLEAGDFVVVELEGVANPGSQGLLTNVAEVENFGENAQASVTTEVTPSISFSSVRKTASPASVLAGDGTINYIIRVENFGTTIDGNDVFITDRLPDGVSSLTITSQPAPNACQITSHPNGTTDLLCGPYDIQDTHSLEIRYKVNVDPDATNPITNSVMVDCSNCASIQTASATTTVIRESELSVIKTSDKDSVIAGDDDIVYTIEVANDGVSDAANVIITDSLPEGTTFVSTDKPTECSYDPLDHTVECTVDSLKVGDTYIVTVNVSVDSDATGTLTNNVTVSSDSNDTDETNNHSSTDAEAESVTDVALSKTGPARIIAGQIITYNLNVTNSGPSNATGVAVSDLMPLSLAFVSSTAPGSLTDSDCTENLGTITCDFGNMGPQETTSKLIQATVSLDAAQIENTAEVFADVNSDTTNNESSFVTLVEPAPQDIILSGIIRDFKASHPDFEYVISDDDGIVKTMLGGDNKPVYNGNPVTVTTTGIVNFNQWYNHVNGINQCATLDIALEQSAVPGFFKYENASFFPIDNQLFGNEVNPHNYHFTYEIHASFVYESGQTLTVMGDDDIWIFIDKKLALDQGGVLPPRTGTINLDTLGLVEGQTYQFDMFFAERHTVQSNLGITTNIPLVSTVPQQCDAVDAVDDSDSTPFETAKILSTLLSNDSNVSTIVSVSQAYHGLVTTDGSSVTYTPNTGFSGTDFFTYTASNTSGLMDTAVVSMTVVPSVQLFCGLPASAYDNIIEGDNNSNTLIGTKGNDLIIGHGGNDKIHGRDGNDCIVAGDGNNKIHGNKGNDTIIAGNGNNHIHGGDGDDIITVGDGNNKIHGNKGNDTILAGNGHNHVHGNQGNDTITTGSGNDKIWGGQGDDVINGGEGHNDIHGNQGNDTITTGSGNDKIWGGQGDDVIDAGAGNNRVHGNQGNDTITTGSGNDWIHAGNGDDFVYAGAGNDTIFGAQGHDTLFGQDNNDTIHGGQGNDHIDGGDGTDKCNGAQGSNTIVNCESEDKKMKEDKEDDEEEEEIEEEDDEGDDKKGNNGNGNGNGNNGNGNGNGNNGNGNGNGNNGNGNGNGNNGNGNGNGNKNK